MRRFLALAGMCLLCTQVFATQEFGLRFSDDQLEISYRNMLEGSNLAFDAGWLHHTDNGDVLHAGIHIVDLASSSRNQLEAGLGGRFVYTNGDLSGQDGYGFPVGGFVRFTPQRMNRLSLFGSLYYAPDILSLGDMDNYREYTLRIGYNVLRQADIYIGARYVRGEYDDGLPDVRFDTGMHIGMTLRF